MSRRQTCTQRVTGRRLRYQRALQIVQNGEYLNAIDLDDIKRYFSFEKQSEASVFTNSHAIFKRSIEEIRVEKPLFEEKNVFQRVKRQVMHVNFGILPLLNYKILRKNQGYNTRLLIVPALELYPPKLGSQNQ